MTSDVGHPVITIDEDACTGCGLCVTECAEGAIEITDGKARVVGDWLCDGIGHCVGACPEGALSVETHADAPSHAAGGAPEPKPVPSSVPASAAEADAGSLETLCTCGLCGVSDREATLVAIRSKGDAGWCCTKCLPSLIHP
jgi:ferredoxin